MDDHYFTKKPVSKLKVREITAIINKKEFSFTTASGVFGKEKADKGTILLIENCIIEDKEDFSILDLGCGYGIIGICLKKNYPLTDITCSDINERAVNITQKNAIKNKVEIKALQSDIFENIDEKFDTILINLPQNAGKKICFKMIEESFNHLKEKGSLQIVSRHQKGGKMYEKKMIEIFNNSRYLAKSGGYRIYFCQKN